MAIPTWVTKKADELAKDEIRRFSIAYKELPEQYHGYMQEFPSNVRIGQLAVSANDEKELKRTHPQIACYSGAIWYKFRTPYLGVDGYLAILNDSIDDNTDVNISFEISQVENCGIAFSYYDKAKKETVTGCHEGKRTLVMATAKVGNKTTTGIAEVEYDAATGGFGSIEIAASSAVRKALGYQGHGRFAIHRTDFGESKEVQEYRAYLINKREAEEKKKSKSKKDA